MKVTICSVAKTEEEQENALTRQVNKLCIKIRFIWTWKEKKKGDTEMESQLSLYVCLLVR